MQAILLDRFIFGSIDIAAGDPHFVLRGAFGVCYCWKNQHFPLCSVIRSLPQKDILVSCWKGSHGHVQLQRVPSLHVAQPWGQLRVEQGDTGPGTSASGFVLLWKSA